MPGSGGNKQNIFSDETLCVWRLLAFWYFVCSEGMSWVHVLLYLLLMTMFLSKQCFASHTTHDPTFGTYRVCKLEIVHLFKFT